MKCHKVSNSIRREMKWAVLIKDFAEVSQGEGLKKFFKVPAKVNTHLLNVKESPSARYHQPEPLSGGNLSIACREEVKVQSEMNESGDEPRGS